MLQSIRLRAPLLVHRRIVNFRFYSDDDEKPKEKIQKTPKVKKVKNEESLKRLNSLLENISASSTTSDAKVIKAPDQKKTFQKRPANKEGRSDGEIAKEVTAQIAERIGGEDPKKTESELLSKLLGLPDLKSHGSLHDLISSMQIDDEQDMKRKEKRSHQDPSRAESVRKSLSGRPPRQTRKFDQSQVKSVVNLFGGTPLGIFDKASTAEDTLKTWDMLNKKELKLAVTHPPSNYFEKMVLWTDQGKIWKFPIDNEQGLDEEFNTDFSEHVLLEMHLEDWCPTSGPVRHFMELVCVGLSNNHWLSAKEKRDHIMWYRDYFNEKKDLLGDLLELGRTKFPPNEIGGQSPQLES